MIIMKIFEEQEDFLKADSVLRIKLQKKYLNLFLQMVQIKKNYFERKIPKVKKHI